MKRLELQLHNLGNALDFMSPDISTRRNGHGHDNAYNRKPKNLGTATVP